MDQKGYVNNFSDMTVLIQDLQMTCCVKDINCHDTTYKVFNGSLT